MYQGHVEVDFENGKALAAVHGLHWDHQGFHMLRDTGNVGWTSECCHRITESFRSDMSYSLYQVCSPLCPGNAQASVNSSLASPEVCRRISHCAKEWETMGGIVDRHSDRASSDEVSEKPWWSYKKQMNDRKCAATVGVQHVRLCCNSWCNDITNWKASHYQSSALLSSERQGVSMTCETWTNFSIGSVHMIHLMAMSHSFVLWPAGWPQVRVMASIVMKQRKSAVRYNEVLTVYLSEMKP